MKKIETKSEYRKQRLSLDKLMDLASQKDSKHIATLLQIIARNIETYESQHFPLEKAGAIDVLKFLMEEHGLTQAELAEIGGQSLVSKILKGERKLTAEQIGRLAHRFNISPSVFYEL